MLEESVAAPAAEAGIDLTGLETLRQCIQCGLCSGACPMGHLMDFTPRQAVLLLKEGMASKVAKSNALWMCVACYACTARCPSRVRITDELFPAVRDLALQSGRQPPTELQKALDNTYRYGNPLGESPKKRVDWTKGAGVQVRILPKAPKPVDALWIVECYPSYHPRNQPVTRKFARILHALGVDFGILGEEESCIGDCERLAGEKGLFDFLVEKNIAALKRHPHKFILTGDPHAYNSLTKVFPKLGFQDTVKHYLQYFYERLEDLRPKLTRKVEATVTYHDNCCLGRNCGLYEPPRALLGAIPGIKLVEMVRSREMSLCCGGGGGGMYLDQFVAAYTHERLSEIRVRQAAATGASVLAVSCPFEILRFDDAIKVTGLERKLVVKDIVELLATSMGLDG